MAHQDAPHGTRIQGCASSAANSPGIELQANDAVGPGTYTTATAYYTDSVGSTWGFANNPATVTITKFEVVGGVIEGSFTANVRHIMNGNAAHSLTGTFHVCHTATQAAP